jgi:hypothetical protein
MRVCVIAMEVHTVGIDASHQNAHIDSRAGAHACRRGARRRVGTACVTAIKEQESTNET